MRACVLALMSRDEGMMDDAGMTGGTSGGQVYFGLVVVPLDATVWL